jgi:hypothetical protein
MKKYRNIFLFVLVSMLTGAETILAQSYQVGVCDWMILKR